MARLFFGLALAGLINIASVIAPVMAADDWVAVTAEDLEGLDAREHDRFDQFYVKSGTDLSSYGSLYLNEPIEFAIEDDEIDDALRTSDRNALSRHFRNALEDRLDGRLTDESGEGILVLQVFIVDVRPNRDLSGDFPSSDTSARRSRSSSRRSVGIGRVTAEMVLMDGASGEIVGVLKDQYSGVSMNSNTNLSTRWGDARDGFRRWARALADLLG